MGNTRKHCHRDNRLFQALVAVGERYDGTIFLFPSGWRSNGKSSTGNCPAFKSSLCPWWRHAGRDVGSRYLCFSLHQGNQARKPGEHTYGDRYCFLFGHPSLLGSRVPLSLKVFLTAFAIVDDIGATWSLPFYAHEVHWNALVFRHCSFSSSATTSSASNATGYTSSQDRGGTTCSSRVSIPPLPGC